MREEERRQLVAELRDRGIGDARVLGAIERVPRHRFVDATESVFAYEDRALPIGCDQTISQPFVVAYMTQLLEVHEGAKVLEVGTGSGYQAAVLAELGAHVYSIEIHAELSASAAAALADCGYDDVRLRVGDGCLGWPEESPFERVIVTAATAEIPPPVLEQLAAGGRFVLPLSTTVPEDQWIWLITKDAARVAKRTRTLPVRFVPLTRAN